MNSSGFSIGDYSISWLGVFLLVAIIVGVVVFIIFQTRKKKIKKHKEEINKITSWQKSHLLSLFDDFLEDAGDAEVQAISNLKGYIKNHRRWNVDEVVALGDKTLHFLDFLIYQEINKHFQDEDFKSTVLWLHLFDFANGGPAMKGDVIDWIGDDISEQKNDLRMDVYEARLMTISTNAIDEVFSLLDPEIDKIPESEPLTDEVLKSYDSIDFRDALSDCVICNDFKNLSDQTIEVLARCLNYEIKKYMANFDGDRFPNHRLYFVRALACCLDRQLYDEVLDTVDMS